MGVTQVVRAQQTVPAGGSAHVSSASGEPASVSCEVSDVTHEGLPATRLANRWVELIFVPKLGGRLMQAKFAGHSYLFENPQLKGKYFPPLELGAPSRWNTLRALRVLRWWHGRPAAPGA